MTSPRNLLLEWTEQRHIKPPLLDPALRTCGVFPTARDWIAFADRLLLFAGSIFIVVGIIFFFAYNWQALDRLHKLGLVEIALLVSVVLSWRLGLDKLQGKAALLSATVLLGALMALYGQIYQTGADTYELFSNWALLALPWVIISRFGPLWLLWQCLVNVAVILYFQTFPSGLLGTMLSTEAVLWILFGLNTIALGLWETGQHLGVTWLQPRWEPRLLALASAGCVVPLMIWYIIDADDIGAAIIPVYLTWTAGGYIVYRYLILDLFMLAVGVFCSILVIVILFLRLTDIDDAGVLLFAGLMVIGLSALGGSWLRQLASGKPS